MNAWLWAAATLGAGVALCLVPAARGGIFHRVIALQAATTLTAFTLALMSQGVGRAWLFDLALAAALISLPGTLVFVRWIGEGT